MDLSYTFPFGQPVVNLVQTDRTPKRVFVLGVYASAVHARWIAPDGKELVKALAVALEREKMQHKSSLTSRFLTERIGSNLLTSASKK